KPGSFDSADSARDDTKTTFARDDLRRFVTRPPLPRKQNPHPRRRRGLSRNKAGEAGKRSRGRVILTWTRYESGWLQEVAGIGGGIGAFLGWFGGAFAGFFAIEERGHFVEVASDFGCQVAIEAFYCGDFVGGRFADAAGAAGGV